MIDRCQHCPIEPGRVCMALQSVCARIHEPEIRAAFLARIREYEARYSAEERAGIERAAAQRGTAHDQGEAMRCCPQGT